MPREHKRFLSHEGRRTLVRRASAREERFLSHERRRTLVRHASAREGRFFRAARPAPPALPPRPLISCSSPRSLARSPPRSLARTHLVLVMAIRWPLGIMLPAYLVGLGLADVKESAGMIQGISDAVVASEWHVVGGHVPGHLVELVLARQLLGRITHLMISPAAR